MVCYFHVDKQQAVLVSCRGLLNTFNMEKGPVLQTGASCINASMVFGLKLVHLKFSYNSLKNGMTSLKEKT